MKDVKIKKMSPTAIIPTYGTSGAACFDLYADSVEEKDWGVLIDTGIAFEIPECHVMMVYSRSGMGFKNGIVLRNGTGVIDSDFRDSVKISLTIGFGDVDFSETTYRQHIALSGIKRGDRIAQAMIIPVEQSNFIVVDELSATDRGTGGLGSTGK